MSNFHVVIPMSGQGTRYQAAGYQDPKPLIKVNGIPMIQRLLAKMPLHWKYHFVLAENHQESGLVELLKELRPSGEILFIGPHKEGPSFAIQSAISQIPKLEPVLVSYCDYGMIWDSDQFEKFVSDSECDACLVSYRGFHAHYLSPQNYAFSRIHGERVVEVHEKGNFTDDREKEFASCGAYYFKNREILEKAIQFQIEQGMSVNGEYYTSLTVEALLKKEPKSHVRIFEIPGFFQWGTPQDLQDFEYWETTYRNSSRAVGYRDQMLPIEQMLIPMAGLGSRFQNLTQIPKPLIEIEQKPMFQRALESFPKSEKVVLVTQRRIAEEAQKKMSQNWEWTSLDFIPEGQALTVEQGLKSLDDDKEVVVTACDHAVIIDDKKWAQFKSKKFDAAIFTVRGFPGVSRKPLAYSYVKTESQDNFPKFDFVSTKKPLTEKPSNELLLVGSFWFKNKEILRQGIEALKQKNIRVNNEIYLDSVFNELKLMNFDIRIFELDGYMNWGDPDSLKEALYWQEIFLGHSLLPRSPFPAIKF